LHEPVIKKSEKRKERGLASKKVGATGEVKPLEERI